MNNPIPFRKIDDIPWFSNLLVMLFFSQDIRYLLKNKIYFFTIVGTQNKQFKATIRIKNIFSYLLENKNLIQYTDPIEILDLLHNFDKLYFPVSSKNKCRFHSSDYGIQYLIGILKVFGISFQIFHLNEHRQYHSSSKFKSDFYKINVHQGPDIIIFTKTTPVFLNRKTTMYSMPLDIEQHDDIAFVTFKNRTYKKNALLLNNDTNQLCCLLYNNEQFVYNGIVVDGKPCNLFPFKWLQIKGSNNICLTNSSICGLKEQSENHINNKNIECYNFDTLDHSSIYVNTLMYAEDYDYRPSEIFSYNYKEPLKTLYCLRNIANLSSPKDIYKFDHSKFNIELLKKHLHRVSPKALSLKETIEKLDKQDIEENRKLYKHFIFSDSPPNYGAKFIASLLTSMGMKNVYDKNHKLNNDLKKTTNFALVTKGTVYGKPLSVNLIQDIFKMFNERPNNIFGDQIRFIILDRSFKEGVDLFDVKYVHIFEPQISKSDLNQAVGRATRACGQSGLTFHPRYGWPLYVNIYDVEFSENIANSILFSNTFNEYFLENMGLSLKLYNFSNELEKYAIIASVDYELTKFIHNFQLDYDNTKNKSQVGFGTSKFLKVRKYINENFNYLKWSKIKLENLCDPKKENNNTNKVVNFTPTQSLLKDYFIPSNEEKGILLWHSVGTGKTCSAIAIASNKFEEANYTILWVTKSSLKSEMWKNMFKTVCNIQLQEMLKSGKVKSFPSDLSKSKKYLSSSWSIQPMSYKQFSNLIIGKNDFYNVLVKKNGHVDPLRKTLLIIDEAHKLFNQEDLSSLEKPDMIQFNRMITNSYKTSKQDSVRLILLTGTPYVSDPMNFVKLLNLLIIDEKRLPDGFQKFEKQFLNKDGKFKKSKIFEFLNSISGIISYLNQQKDPRKFAQPMFYNVHSKMSMSYIIPMKNMIESELNKIEKLSKLVDVNKLYIKQLMLVKKTETEKCKAIRNRNEKKQCHENISHNLNILLDISRKYNQDSKIKENEIKNNVKLLKSQINIIKNDEDNDISQEQMLHDKCGLFRS